MLRISKVKIPDEKGSFKLIPKLFKEDKLNSSDNLYHSIGLATEKGGFMVNIRFFFMMKPEKGDLLKTKNVESILEQYILL